MTELTYSSATRIAAAIRNKHVSCREVVDAHLQQIERANRPLNAVVHVLAESARQQATAADAALARGHNIGPFHGVPMTVKDAWEVAGVPSTGGTLGRANYIPEQDATVIGRMRAAGAIPIGMTNLPELSMAFESDNLVHGRTNNPYDLSRTPGGSGGGGAAAIAAGMSPIEIGADLGGSIRLPCHFSGIAGIRPTTGRAPLTGYFPPALGWVSDFAACGPMARYVEDLITALPVISGIDWIDPCVHDMPLLASSSVSIKGLRVAVHTNNGIRPARSDVAAVVMRAAKALADAGAIAGVDMYRSTMLSFLKNYDLILCPVNALPAVEHGTSLKPELMPAFSYTFTYNVTGWPGAVVRCGTSTEGLPVGVQAVARPWREDVSLAVAMYLETALGGYVRPSLAASAG